MLFAIGLRPWIFCIYLIVYILERLLYLVLYLIHAFFETTHAFAHAFHDHHAHFILKHFGRTVDLEFSLGSVDS